MTDKKARVNVDPGLEYPELTIWDHTWIILCVS